MTEKFTNALEGVALIVTMGLMVWALNKYEPAKLVFEWTAAQFS